ncbi:hypothetical protein COOONC_13096, partial [Cooperia oncophora]
MYDWLTGVNSGKSIDIIYFDLTKAFDKVCHDKLISKLKLIGIQGRLLEWLKSYLRDSSSGVPQGGALSPLLFLIYTLDLPKVSRFIPVLRLKCLLMISESIVFTTVMSNQKDTNAKLIHRELVHRLGTPPQFGKNCTSPSGTLPTHPVSKCSVKDLGILFDVRLAFDEHIEMVVKKAIRCLFLVLRNVQCNDPSLLVRLYNIYIRPHLEYGSIVWSPWMKKHENRLERVQKTFTRLAFY